MKHKSHFTSRHSAVNRTAGPTVDANCGKQLGLRRRVMSWLRPTTTTCLS